MKIFSSLILLFLTSAFCVVSCTYTKPPIAPPQTTCPPCPPCNPAAVTPAQPNTYTKPPQITTPPVGVPLNCPPCPPCETQPVIPQPAPPVGVPPQNSCPPPPTCAPCETATPPAAAIPQSSCPLPQTCAPCSSCAPCETTAPPVAAPPQSSCPPPQTCAPCETTAPPVAAPPPQTCAPCNQCQDPVKLYPCKDICVEYRLCDFEIKYNVTANKGKPLELAFSYPGDYIVKAVCPEGKVKNSDNNNVDFIHIAEFKCTEAESMKVDLYLPYLHLKGSGIKLTHLVDNATFDIIF